MVHIPFRPLARARVPSLSWGFKRFIGNEDSKIRHLLHIPRRKRPSFQLQRESIFPLSLSLCPSPGYRSIVGWDGSTSEKSDSDCEKIAQNFYQSPSIIFRHGPNLSLNPSHIITVNNPQSFEITILFTMRFLFLPDWQI